eukprot:UN24996
MFVEFFKLGKIIRFNTFVEIFKLSKINIEQQKICFQLLYDADFAKTFFVWNF